MILMKLILRPIVSTAARIAGFAAVLVILFNMFNSKFGFLSVDASLQAVTVQNWLILACVALVGLDLSLRVPFLFLFYLAIIVIIIVLACIPGFELPLVGELCVTRFPL